MQESVIVFGAGRFGRSLATTLFDHGVEVMIVDHDYDLIQSLSTKVTTAIQCDLTDEAAVNELGISNFDIAVIAIGSNLEASIMATLASKDRGVPRIIAKATSEMQARILEKIGADQIIYPEIDMGERLARSISGSNLMEYIHFSDEYSIVEVKTNKEWVGKNLVDLDFRNKYHLNVIAYRRNGRTIVAPSAKDTFERDDVLILIGEEKYIDALVDNA